jgi:hypothetical protein
VTVWGVAMVRDEADIVTNTLIHMADEVDQLLVADNGSTDGTREILAELTRILPLTVVDDPDPAYYQAVKMTRLAEQAAAAGAEWVVAFDADECWYGPDRISTVLAGCAADVATAALTNHFRTAVDVDDPNPYRSMVWRAPQPVPLVKVAVRWRPGAQLHQGNHGVTLPGVPPLVAQGALSIRHFPVRSAAQFYRKSVNGAAAYAATTLPEHEGAHWRAYGRLIEQGGRELMDQVYTQHWWYLSPPDSGLVYDPAPYRRWQQ